MVSDNQVRCDEKFLFDVFNIDGSTISIRLYANKKSVKQYLKDTFDSDDQESITFKDGLSRLNEFERRKNNPKWIPSWLTK